MDCRTPAVWLTSWLSIALIVSPLLLKAKSQVEPGPARTSDVGPEIGLNASFDGFIVNRRDPTQVLGASNRAGVAKSRNGGLSWYASNVGLTLPDGTQDYLVRGLRADPGDPLSVYAIALGGLYRSTDFGDHWSRLEGETLDLTDVAIHPSEPGGLFALSQVGTTSPLLRSTDDGVTFEPYGTGFPQAEDAEEPTTESSFINVVIVPSAPNVMYVLQTFPEGDHTGVFKSIDGGQTFACLAGAPDYPLQAFAHPTDPDVLFVQAGSGSTGLFVSRNAGATFESVTEGLEPGGSSFIAFDPLRPSTVYFGSDSGFYQSIDTGRSFHRLGLAADQIGDFVMTFSVDPTESRVLYVNTSEGNFKSEDEGRHFRAINHGWTMAAVTAIAFDHSPRSRLLVGANGRLMSTANHGAQYERLGEDALPQAFISAIATGVSDPDFLMVGTTTRGLFRSLDGGLSWEAATAAGGQAFRDIAAIAIDPADANRVHAIARLAAFTPPGVYRSTDGGRSFEVLANAPSSALALAVGSEQSGGIYVGGAGLAPLSVSRDAGATFTRLMSDWVGSIRTIALDPSDSRIVYASGFFVPPLPPFPPDPGSPPPPPPRPRQLLRSSDAGVTFVPADSGLEGFILNVVVDPETPSRLFAWVRGAGLYMTADRGQTWTLVDGDESRARTGSRSTNGAMAVNPRDPHVVYLGGVSVLEVQVPRQETR